ncbi:glycosyltransferase family 2 protein [Carboxydocella sp. JDF658]|uniref:glycosyltransferase family 2 protein n=1 Tax=Carboxydocella sp. JDF658 TaxID=1926600 RepID=UPI0009AC1B12|nr:glycosyltransferase family 2 protein [Carboxydocella sp. JDF658]GAW31250.1 hypothetical protein JDF658_10150 [Carboxydocella sp. JDF658]
MIHIQIITFNNQRIITNCLQSVNKQILKDYSVGIIDNASHDNTVDLIKKFHNIAFKQNTINLGYAAAHNQGLREQKADYIFVLNPDIQLAPNFLKELINTIQQDPSIGMVCGKLLRMTTDGQLTNIIDSTGLILKKNRRAFDRGQGEEDRGQYDEPGYVFGCSGAAVLYRREMLEDIKVLDEYFDESFFAYKEDVDLAWRAQLRGWKAYYNPKAVAYHVRGWKENGRDQVPRFVQIHSYKNRYLMLLKNDTLMSILRALPQFLLYEFAAFIYALFRRPYLLKGWVQIFKLLPLTWKKRKIIQSRRKVTPREIEKWFE